MQSIFKFHPIYKERPWGGKSILKLAQQRLLPPGKKIGESWEISDRAIDESVIANGTFKGKSIRWLLSEHGTFVMGQTWETGRRFPLLVKILDAAERLSLQVHPPIGVASQLGGEPKTEMWYLLGAEPDAAVLAGLRKGVRREDFEKALSSGEVESLVHRIHVQKGDAVFIPSGRLHAIDAGCLILEIQQNSDTTYRVYDWGRVGLDGKPRKLHVKESLQCIDFSDFEPSPVSVVSGDELSGTSKDRERLLSSCDYFSVSWHYRSSDMKVSGNAFVLYVLKGTLDITSNSMESVSVCQGETILLAANEHGIHPVSTGQEFILTTCYP